MLDRAASAPRAQPSPADGGGPAPNPFAAHAGLFAFPSPSLTSLAKNEKRAECHAMLDRGEGNVNECGEVSLINTARA
jgi:hypothetical protein